MSTEDSPIPTPAITEELLRELRRLEAEATPGEWRIAGRFYPYDDGNIVSVGTNERDVETVFMGEPIDGYNPPISGKDADKALVVALRNAAPALLAVAARLKETEADRDKYYELWEQLVAAATPIMEARNSAADERDQARADLAELVAALPKCEEYSCRNVSVWIAWGEPSTCCCDAHVKKDTSVPYEEQPWAPLLRRIASRKGTG